MKPTLRIALFLSLIVACPAPAADALPKGATLRLGSTRLRDPFGWTNATLAPDGKHLMLQTNRGTQKYALATGELAGVLGEKNAAFGRAMKFNSDASRVLGIAYSDVSVWDAATGKTLASVKRSLPFGDGTASIAANGKIIAVGGSQDFNAKDKPVTALVWDVEKNAKIAEIPALQNQSVLVALSPDGKTLATWGTHFERNPPKEGVDPANDPNRIVQIWDAATGKETSKIRLDGYGSPSALFSPDGKDLAISSGNGLIRILDSLTGTERRRLFGRSDQGSRLAFSPDGNTLATGGTDCTVQLWNAADGTRLKTIPSPAEGLNVGIRGISFTDDKRAVAWTAVGFTALAWEIPSGNLLTPLAGHVSTVRSIAFPEGTTDVLTGGDDGQILRWAAGGEKPVGEKPASEARPQAPGGFNALTRYPMAQITLTADGKTALGQLSQPGTYDAATGKQIAAPQAGIGLETRTYLCSDGRTFLLVPQAAYPPKPTPRTVKISVWDLTSGSKHAELETPPCELIHAVLTPDRTKLVTVTTTRTEMKTEFHVTTWELKTGTRLGSYTESGGFGNTYLAAVRDNASVLVSAPSGKLLAIDIADGKVVKELDTGRRSLTAHPAFAPEGNQVAVAVAAGFGPGAGAEIMLFDWESGKKSGTFRGHNGAVTTLAYSRNGKSLATGSFDTTVLLWDVSAAEK